MNVELSDRQKNVLQSIVQEYISSAVPVSSKTLTAGYKLGVSAATIRNEMAALEELGCLTHPHTSAGRVPTEKGYRYYVENLMQRTVLPGDEQRMINHQFHQTRSELEQWLRLSAAVLAHISQNASLITAPTSGHSQLKHVDIVSIQDTTALVILVIHGGIVKQQIVSLQQSVSREQLSVIARQLTDLWSDLDARGIAKASHGLVGLSAEVSQVAIDTMRRIDAHRSSEIYRDGLLNVMRQPEFEDKQKIVQQIIRALEESWLVEQLVDETLQRGGIQIIIGGEGKWDELSQVSLVLARYGIDDKMTGVMGIVGPMRMSYGRSISAVRYISYLMSDLINNLYGE
jgi:heat-inducible transcriptional repressor